MSINNMSCTLSNLIGFPLVEVLELCYHVLIVATMFLDERFNHSAYFPNRRFDAWQGQSDKTVYRLANCDPQIAALTVA